MLSARHFTAADLATMPDDGRRHEAVRGELLVTPAPGGRHQSIVTRVLTGLMPYVALVAVLDGLYRVRFRTDAESLAAWDSSRNLVGSFRRRRSPAEPAPSPDPDPAPAPAQVVALVARPDDDLTKPE